MKAFLRDYWIPVLFTSVLVTPIIVLVCDLHKKEHISSEKILFEDFDPTQCQLHSVIWFDDDGKPVAAKARVCEAAKEENK